MEFSPKTPNSSGNGSVPLLVVKESGLKGVLRVFHKVKPEEFGVAGLEFGEDPSQRTHREEQ